MPPLPASIGVLLDALADADATVRWEATKILSALGDKRIVLPLLAAIIFSLAMHASCLRFGRQSVNDRCATGAQHAWSRATELSRNEGYGRRDAISEVMK